jgi:hypothetical protein
LLFVATIASVVFVGSGFDLSAPHLPSPAQWLDGLQYAAGLLGVLVAHETGHYVAARLHRVDASPPFFIPLPLGLGTMGAVIRMRGRIATRAALLDIGASGPLAGLMIAFPVYAWGVAHSKLIALDDGKAYEQLGSSLAVRAIEHFFGPHVPAGMDVLLSPAAFGAWAGMLVTMLNLLPVGQLDGGHVAYALFGPKQDAFARNVHRALLAVFFASVVGYTFRDWRAGIGLAHFAKNVGNSVFWLAWFLVLPILGMVAARGDDKPAGQVSLRTRVVSLVGLLAMASLGGERHGRLAWLGFFGGLALLLAMEARGGTLTPHALFEHPATGTEPLGRGRKAVAVLTLAMFVALFMPTPISM